MSNHITIEFCQEDRKRIDELIGLAAWITGALKDMAAAAQPAETAEPVNEHPADAVIPFTTPEPAAEPEQVNYTKDDIQALVMKLAAPNTGKKEAARAIVYEYAQRISGIPEDKVNEVMARLLKLAEEE